MESKISKGILINFFPKSALNKSTLVDVPSMLLISSFWLLVRVSHGNFIICICICRGSSRNCSKVHSRCRCTSRAGNAIQSTGNVATGLIIFCATICWLLQLQLRLFVYFLVPSSTYPFLEHDHFSILSFICHLHTL